ncbi:MAG: putative surface protein with fasciclin (FAS1) repeats, partial [Flavobacteriales bacterium]
MNKNLLITSLRKLALSAVLAFTVIGLRAQSVYDFIAASPDHTSLTAAIDAAGLAATLSGPGEFTVFAPTDAAFDAALAELGVTLGDLAADVPALTGILLYHVVDGIVLSSELMNGMTPTPLNDANTIKVTVTGGSEVFVNQAEVTGADNETGNGVVHVTDGVILATETVVDVALSTGVHTSLVAAVTAAELLPALTNPFAELTVFAPTDDAFTAALAELGVTLGDLAADIPALQAILTYHVVNGTVLSSELTNGMTPTPLNDANTIKVTVTGGSEVFVNQAQVTAPDNSTGNGVVHVTDGVILATETVVDVALSTGVHTSLVAAVIAAELLPALTNPFAELTVFAPTDDAFTAALTELGVTLGDLAADIPALQGILTYHVVDGTVLSSDLTNGMTPTPLNDANTIKVTVTGGSEVFVNQAQVTGPDNSTGNGVVHVTDGVILTTETVVDVALSTGVHTSLVAAVIAAELLPALTNPFAELTVFAPTDDAFTAALTELGVTLGDLAADIPALQAILTYHVVDGTVLSSDLTNGMTPTPLNAANTIKVTVGGSGVFVNQAEVTGADNETGNGVVHVTDGVIL